MTTSPAVTVVPGPPVINSLSPAGAPVGGAAFTLTVNGSGFTSGSVVRWNGSDRVTTYTSASQLRAAILASDLATIGTAQVAVFVPTSGALSPASPFAISPAPQLTLSATQVTAGTAVTMTLAGGFGGSTDWLALASTTAPNNSYLQYTYVGAGVSCAHMDGAVDDAGHLRIPPVHQRIHAHRHERADHGDRRYTAGSRRQRDDSRTRHACHGDVDERVRRRIRLDGLAPAGSSDRTYLDYTYVGGERDDQDVDGDDAEHAGHL